MFDVNCASHKLSEDMRSRIDDLHGAGKGYKRISRSFDVMTVVTLQLWLSCKDDGIPPQCVLCPAPCVSVVCLQTLIHWLVASCPTNPLDSDWTTTKQSASVCLGPKHFRLELYARRRQTPFHYHSTTILIHLSVRY